MDTYVGIDLGSTTTKAVVIDIDGKVLGRGITNSRSNYDVACEVSLGEAVANTRFSLVASHVANAGFEPEARDRFLAQLELGFRQQQYLNQLEALRAVLARTIEILKLSADVTDGVDSILNAMTDETDELFDQGANRKSDFFRDLSGSRYLHYAEDTWQGTGISYDRLASLFDAAILDVENDPAAAGTYEANMTSAMERMESVPPPIRHGVRQALDRELRQAASVGTGYGRQRLPFPEAQIRSEILCHGLGAHSMFPGTRTVLDIGGQDTKAIQVDEHGIVTSFQMNDRCAAGCGRYLGYIADEMNLGIHELGPLAGKSKRPTRINSTCTVFAGAELRERLSLGEKREDILAGLHRAIILRAMSLLARSGGVFTEFSFTGGVAKNPEAVKALKRLIQENYGELQLNISPNSIYTGALGAALFARDGAEKEQAA